MNFNEAIKDHLKDYKKKNHPNCDHGIWRPKTDNKILHYAFTKMKREYNLLEPYRDDFLKSSYFNRKNRVKFHMYFHHLNSSQAVCFNFFFPLEAERKLDLVLEYLGLHGEKTDYSSPEFEKLSDIDSKGGHRPTNFDYYLKTESGKEFFFEIKYTEQGFGKAKDDIEHKKKYAAIYSKELKAISSAYSNKDAFLANYQIMRNLIHIDKDKYVVFVFPEKNKGIKKGAEKAKNEILASAYKSNLRNVYWEDLHKYCTAKITDKKLNVQMKEFGEKYFLKPKI